MMGKKVLYWTLALLFGFLGAVGFFGGMTMLTVQHSAVTIITLLVFIVLAIVGIWSCTLLTRYALRLNKPPIQNRVKLEDACNNHNSNASLPPRSTGISQAEVPKETIRDMRKSYWRPAAEDDVRQYYESVDLLRTTDNFDTFMSRREFAYKKALTLKQAFIAGLHKDITKIDYLQPLETDYPNMLSLFLERWYNRAQTGIAGLKTDSGKLNRINKSLDELSRYYEDQIEFIADDMYNEVKEKLERQKVQLTKTSTPKMSRKASNLTPAEQIREFSKLREDGLLTEEEFQAKKKQLLGI